MAEAGPIPFQEAIDFFRGKVNMPTAKWDDLRQGAHVRAWSIAGMTRDDWLSEMKAEIIKAQVEGTGLKAFQKSFDAFVDRTGWKFNARGDTDLERRAWRSRLIYKQNMRSSYMAGRYKQMSSPAMLKARPYWCYRHSDAVLHPRMLHVSWDGKVWLATDPVWDKIFPPNGFGCGCDVDALSERDLARLGKTGPDPSPDLAPYEQKDRRTGKMVTRYIGIDKGFEYNVGKEWLQGVVPPAMHQPLPPAGGTRTPIDLPALPAPDKVDPSRIMPTGLTAADYGTAFLKEFGIDPHGAGFYRDKANGVIAISASMFDGYVGNGRYMRLYADVIRDPDEIWMDFGESLRGTVLRRAYIKRFALPDGTALFVRYEWTKYGWTPIATFDDAQAAELYRTGALLYRK